MIAISQKTPYLLVGTYTGGKSKGIYIYRFGQKGTAEKIDSIVTLNPSYLTVSPDQRFVYAVNELGNKEGGGKVSAFAFDKTTGKLILLNQQSAEGEHPCYLTIDKSGKWVIVGNYSSGTVAVLPVQENGSLGKAVSIVRHKGSSVHARQESTHVHATVLSADNRLLYVPDLGTDQLMVYHFDAQNGSLQPKDTMMKLPPGSGPRHFDLHPKSNYAYLLQELSGMVTSFQVEDDGLKPLQTISVLPPNFSQSFTSADIHVSPDGKFLYTTTRDASNTIAIFRINQFNGKLSVVGHQSTLGKTPRNFSIDPSGKYLLVANQNSDEIVIFKINKKTGQLSDAGNRISVGNPVCLKWITM